MTDLAALAKLLAAPAVPRLALTRVEAAASLAMGVDTFEIYVLPDLKVLPAGKVKRVIPVAELERWVAENAESVLPGERACEPHTAMAARDPAGEGNSPAGRAPADRKG
jgi:hypothetical protein